MSRRLRGVLFDPHSRIRPPTLTRPRKGGGNKVVSRRRHSETRKDSCRREQQGEARAADPAIGLRQILGEEPTAMGFDDLARDAEAETGMGPELLPGRTLGIEAVEDRLQLVRRNAGALIGDAEADAPTLAAGKERDGPLRRAEG